MRACKTICLFLLGAWVCAIPLDVWSKSKDKEPKVMELLQPANDMMSEASAAYIDGKAKEAIEGYRKALAELVRLERENPARATSSSSRQSFSVRRCARLRSTASCSKR